VSAAVFRKRICNFGPFFYIPVFKPDPEADQMAGMTAECMADFSGISIQPYPAVTLLFLVYL